MNVREMMSSPACMRLVVTLLHFVWQGLAIALVAIVAAKAFGRRSSRIRYGLHVAALFAMVVAVVVTYAVVQPPAASHAARAGSAEEAAAGKAPGSRLSADMAVAPVEVAVAHKAMLERPAASRVAVGWQQAAPYAAGAYLVGVLLMLGRLVVGLHGGGRLRRRSQPVGEAAILTALARQARALGLSITPAIAYCSRVVVPTVVGVFRPMLLLPFSFATGLAPEQVEALLAHELAHVRRLDPLVNVAQRAIEALLFFHPAVWFVSHRIRVEREHCCDDLVVGAGASATTYASSLVEVAKRGLLGGSAPRPVPQGVGLADRPSRLRARIVRLLGHQAHERMRLRRAWLVGLVLVAVVGLAAGVCLGGGPARGGEGAAAGGTSDADAGQAGQGDAASAPDIGDAVLDVLGQASDPDASLRVKIDLLFARVSKTALKGILDEVAPGSGDPTLKPLVLSAEQRKALDAALAALPEDDYQRLSAPRLLGLNRTRATIEIVGKQREEGKAAEGVRFSCAPVVSADRKSIVLVLFSKTAEGKPAGSLRFGPDAFQLPSTDEGGPTAAYRIANGGTLVLTGPDEEPHVQLALVAARTVDEEADAARRAIVEKLNTHIPQLDFKDAPLREVVNYLSRQVGVNIVLDPKLLAEAGAGADEVTLRLQGVPFRDALRYLLMQKGLTFVVEEHALVVVPLDGARAERPVGPAAKEAAEARARLVEKLKTPIPQVDFVDAPLREVLSFVSREMGVNIVLDAKALAGAGADAKVSLALKGVPFGEVLRYVLRLKGLTFVVEDYALVVVTLEDAAGRAVAEADAVQAGLVEKRAAAEAAAARARLDEKLNTRIPQVDFTDAPLKEVLDFLGREMDVNIVIDPKVLADGGADGDITLQLKDVPFREVLKFLLRQKDLTFVVEANAIVVVPSEEPAAAQQEFETVVFRLSGDGTSTMTDADGKPRVVMIDERLRRAEGVAWPVGSSIHYYRPNGSLIVTNTPESIKVIRGLVKEWDTPPTDLDDETSLEFGVEILRLDAAAYARIKKRVLGELDDWRKPSLVLNAEATSALISALNADPSCKRSFMTTVAPTTSGQTYKGSAADPDDKNAVLYDIAYTASVLPDGTGFKLILDPEMTEGEFGCLFHIDPGVLARSDRADGGRQAVYELKHGDTVLLEGVEQNEDGQTDVAFMYVRVFDMAALREAQEAQQK
jgi:hypothetical protein